MPDMPTNVIKQPHGAEHIAPDVHGRNFYAIDRQFQDLLSLYLEPGLRAAMTPHFERLGALAGNRLDELAMVARATASAATRTGSTTIPPTARWRRSPSRNSACTP
jgi:hypothetical protein